MRVAAEMAPELQILFKKVGTPLTSMPVKVATILPLLLIPPENVEIVTDACVRQYATAADMDARGREDRAGVGDAPGEGPK